MYLDSTSPKDLGCNARPTDGLSDKQRGGAMPPFVTYTCQFSFPIIEPLKMAPDNVLPGTQNDGVHRIDADMPVGVIVSGFDSYVSYAYAGGTDLKGINVPQ